MWLAFAVIAVGILANGLFAGSEIALVSSRISRLADMRQRSVHGAAAAMQLKETPDAFLAQARRLIAIRIDPQVHDAVRREAKTRGLGYQSLINDLLATHIGRVRSA